MSLPSNTYDTYAQIGIREDLSDVIWDISPTDTPFITMAKKTKATSTLHEWQTDALAAASTSNAQIEGDDATADAATATVRLKNSTLCHRHPGPHRGRDGRDGAQAALALLVVRDERRPWRDWR